MSRSKMQEFESEIPPGATVVIPTLNRGRYLEQCLRDVLGQTYRPLEILVVDQSEVMDESVRLLVEAHPNEISYRTVPFRSLPMARNYGWQQAKYDRIVFLDDDIRCGPDLVTEHVKALELPNVGAAAGGVYEASKTNTPAERPGRFNRWTATPRRSFCGHGWGEIDHGPGCNFSVWRETIRDIGGVDEGMNVGAALHEETDLFLRIGEAGYKVWFNGKARLTHLAAPSGGCRMDRLESYVFSLARNRTVLIRRHTRLYHYATAFARLVLLVAAYKRTHHDTAALRAGWKGVREGLRVATRQPICTSFEQAEFVTAL